MYLEWKSSTPSKSSSPPPPPPKFWVQVSPMLVGIFTHSSVLHTLKFPLYTNWILVYNILYIIIYINAQVPNLFLADLRCSVSITWPRAGRKLPHAVLVCQRGTEIFFVKTALLGAAAVGCAPFRTEHGWVQHKAAERTHVTNSEQSWESLKQTTPYIQ